LSNSFARVAEQIEPAVVNITTETTVRISGRGFGSQGQEPFGDFFNRFLTSASPADLLTIISAEAWVPALFSIHAGMC